jgi:hypothetical protein
MFEKQIETEVYGAVCTLTLLEFIEDDRAAWKKLFDTWAFLTNGMKGFKSRGVNLPEGISESAYCLLTGSCRLVSGTNLPNSSFDTYNEKSGMTEQIKACSVKSDLTSFGPKSKWDILFFLDFYNNGNLNGQFNVYQIPNEIIYSAKVNKNHTFRDFQLMGKRPRLSIKKIIVENNIEPKFENIIIYNRMFSFRVTDS